MELLKPNMGKVVYLLIGAFVVPKLIGMVR